MTTPLVSDPNHIRLAMLGMVEGNGHPFSWSAIINGSYDKQVMADCGYPVIPQYLDAQPPENLGIAGMKVTHVWCDQPQDAEKVAAAAHIPNVVSRPEDVIGQVDAVVIATDDGHTHMQRVRPFIEAGLPAFIDKPLTDNRADLQQFDVWHRAARPFLSTSCMHYAREFADLRSKLDQIGDMRAITVMMCKSWERYGIHALEAAWTLLPPGECLWVTNTGDEQANVVHVRHSAGVDLVMFATHDLFGSFGQVQAAGVKGLLATRFADTFFAFKEQLKAFAAFLRTGQSPVAWDQTRRQMAVIIAGLESRRRGGERIELREILT
ncbi:MAG: Gfo/Idh/MocA family oxidoreductase [Phycisphaeraceae bacterium]|nr:Gfo/Idh/MocA family oxidoreductase [Phycisphaeraceae bacterium]